MACEGTSGWPPRPDSTSAPPAVPWTPRSALSSGLVLTPSRGCGPPRVGRPPTGTGTGTGTALGGSVEPVAGEVRQERVELSEEGRLVAEGRCSGVRARTVERGER